MVNHVLTFKGVLTFIGTVAAAMGSGINEAGSSLPKLTHEPIRGLFARREDGFLRPVGALVTC